MDWIAIVRPNFFLKIFDFLDLDDEFFYFLSCFY